MQSFIIVWVEIGGQTGLQLGQGVILVEIDVLIFDTAPLTFTRGIVEVVAASIYSDLNVGYAQGSETEDTV